MEDEITEREETWEIMEPRERIEPNVSKADEIWERIVVDFSASDKEETNEECKEENELQEAVHKYVSMLLYLFACLSSDFVLLYGRCPRTPQDGKNIPVLLPSSGNDRQIEIV